MRLGIVLIVLSALASALADKWYLGNRDPCRGDSQCLPQHYCIIWNDFGLGIYVGNGGRCLCGLGRTSERCGQCKEIPPNINCKPSCQHPTVCLNKGGNSSCVCDVGSGYTQDENGMCKDPCVENGKPCVFPKMCSQERLVNGRPTGPRKCQCPLGYEEENGNCRELCKKRPGPCHETANCLTSTATQVNGINGLCQCPSGTTGDPSKNGSGCRSLCVPSCGHDKKCTIRFMENGTRIHRCRCPLGKTDDPNGICVEACQPPCNGNRKCVESRNWNYPNEFRYIYRCKCKHSGPSGTCLSPAEYQRRDNCGNTCRADQQCDRQNPRSKYKCFCPCGQKDVGGKCVQEN